MKRPEIVYGAGVSLDGYIADSRKTVEYLNPFFGPDYAAFQYMRTIDTYVMGRLTYQDGVSAAYAEREQRRLFVLSRTQIECKDGAVLWNRSVEELVDHLAEIGSGRVWLMGGGITASAFLEAGLLDQVLIAVMPLVLGSGTPMFGPLKEQISLKLQSSRQFENGVVEMNYARVAGKSATSKS